MYKHYKEALLPLMYRQKEIACLLTPLAMQRSVRVAGLSGMGKSNLLRFLVSHPQVLENNLALASGSVCFLYIDCNRLNPVSAFSFYRECYFLLQAEQAPAVLPDEYLAFKQVEGALRKLDQQRLVILVIDRIEDLYAKTGREFFSQLRNLRDEARAGRMSFIFAGRRPVGYLYELEKLFSDTCWVGPLREVDRPEFFSRHEARLKIRVEEKLAMLLWQLSGGHPGLLKNGLEWVKRQGAARIPAEEAELILALLAYEPIRRYCQKLWENLTQAEQNFLMELPGSSSQGEIIHYLRQNGLIVEQRDRLSLFSPLWAAYLRQNIWSRQPVQPLYIELDPATRRVMLQWRGKTAEAVINRRLVFACLQLLAAAPGRVYSKDELINTLYPEERAPEVLDDALFQLITALRRALDGPVKSLCPAMSGSCIENVRGVGYRLVVELPIRPIGSSKLGGYDNGLRD